MALFDNRFPWHLGSYHMGAGRRLRRCPAGQPHIGLAPDAAAATRLQVGVRAILVWRSGAVDHEALVVSGTSKSAG